MATCGAGSDEAALELLASLEEGVLVLADGRLVGANGALQSMSGYAHEQLLGRPVEQLFTDPHGHALAGLESSNAARLRDREGRLVPVSLRRVSDRVFLVIDRSRERRLEQEVWRLAGPDRGGAGLPLGSLASEAAGMIEHEIGTAQTVIAGFLRMLLEERGGPLTAEQRAFLLEARRETERIGELAANLVELVACEAAHPLRVVRKPERLRPLVEGIAFGCRPLLEARRMDMRLELELEDDRVCVDAARIERVLVNLVSNAAKFAPEGSTVRVAAHDLEQSDGRYLCIAVIDEGPGVTRDEADEIFRPFVRGVRAASSAPGAGLGLAVCHAIAGSHGGRVEAVPDLGHGHFQLVLPADS